MKPALLLPCLLGIFLAGCGNNQNPSTPAATPASPPVKPTNAPVAAPLSADEAAPRPAKPAVEGGGYLGGLANGKAQAVGTIDVASLTQAISMFNVDEGRYPKSLQELVDQKYIGRIPAAPYGKKLDYNATTGVVRVVEQ